MATETRGRTVRALPVIALASIALTLAAILAVGRLTRTSGGHATPTVAQRHTGEPTAVHDEDHYVPGSPPAVCERFLRAWMRARYDEARDLATGALHDRAVHALAEVQAFTPPQQEEYRRTRVYVDATHFDLEHIALRDLPAGASGAARKEVQGQAHAYGAFDGTQVDSRRGQTFVVELVDGAWRVADRSWETFERTP